MTMPSNGLAGSVKYWSGKIDMMTTPMPYDLGTVPTTTDILKISHLTLAGGAQLGLVSSNPAVPPKPDALNAVGAESKPLWQYFPDLTADPGGNLTIQLSLPAGTPPVAGITEAELYYVLP